MSLYSFVLIVHVAAVFVLCAALSIEAVSLFHLRRASTLVEVQPWIEPFPKLSAFLASSGLLILLSGVYLVFLESALSQVWPKVAVAALLLLAPLGAISGRRMRALREAFKSAKAISPELLDQLQDTFLKISLAIRICVFLGIFLLVSLKPALWDSISTVGASVILALVLSAMPSRGGASLPTRSMISENKPAATHTEST